MKRIYLFLSIFVLVALACDLSVTVASPTSPAPLPTNTMIQASAIPTQIPASVTPVPATLAPSATPTTQQPSFEGEEVFVSPVTIHISPELAGGVHGIQVARLDGADAAWWQRTPGHTELKLEAYRLQGKSLEPQILVYPAQAYAEMAPVAFESMHRLNNILGGLPFGDDQLPAIPFFNSQQAFASHFQVISFQNGRGVRFLTEYAQYAVSANNSDLFYHFQGFTSDGFYYIVAILPISNPMLAETRDGGAVLPPGGIPYPYFAEGANADMQSYYANVITLLNATSPQAFTPTINQLDSLIQSMRVTP